MRGWISVLAALVTGAILAGVPTITGVTAQQRYPWNGMVDIAVTFEGASNDVAQADCSFVATNSVTKAALLVAHIERLGDDTGTGTTWTRRFVWDAGADVGEVKIADVTLSVEAEMPLGGVQLWENGPYWAECNVGATQPEEYGYYFWWGDTVGYAWSGGTSTDDFYYSDVTWVSSKKRRMRNSPFCSSSCPTDDKSTSMLLSEGYIDVTGNLVAKYDAATAHLGAPWRMPTSEEIQALVDNCCTTTWTTRNGVYGQLVTGKGAYASKSIFLPAAGYGYDSDLNALGFCGGYLSSTPVSDDSSCAEDLYFDGLGPFCRVYDSRVYGQSVRPIRGFDSAGMCGMATTSLVLDTRTGTRTVAAKESIAYDATWGEAASGTLAVNDTAVSGLSKMGTYVWTPNTPQTNYWKLAYKAGTANYSATFQSLDKYTITYTETKGAANTNPTQYNILDSIMFTALPNVTGYMFKGWAPSKIDSGGFGAKTVIAQWTPITFTVKFNANGGTGTMANELFTYDTAKALTANAFMRTGYTFKGWATSTSGAVVYADKASVKNLTAAESTTVNLYAVWSINRHTVTMDSTWGDGGSATYDHGSTVTLHAPGEVVDAVGTTKYVCRGSSAYPQAGTNVTLTITDGLTFSWDIWETNYWISAAVEGPGKIRQENAAFVDGWRTNGCTVTLVAVPSAGARFVGWTGDVAGGTVDGAAFSFTARQPCAIGATFAELESYELTYANLKGATHANPSSYTEGTAVTFSDPSTVTGYTFSSWTPTKITADMRDPQTVTANWTANAYTVKFNENGGTGLMADLPMTYDFAKRLRECSFKRVGYNFQGWATRKDGLVAYGDGDSVKNLTATDGGEVTLYAVWKRQDPWQGENDQPFNPLVANVYDGYLVGEDQSVVGTIQVKTAKQAVKKLTDKVTKEVSFVTNVAVTAMVTDAAAKKWSYSKGALRMPITDGRTSVTGLVCTTKGVVVTNFEVSVGLNGMSGIWGKYEIVGARNGMGVKNDSMMATLDGYKKSWSVTVGETRLQVMVGAKGTTKIVGVTPDGFKINASVQGVMGNGCLDVPYTATLKNGKLTKSVDLLLRIGADGTVDVLSSSLGGLAAGGATEEPVIADRRTAATLLVGVAYAEKVDIQELGYPAKFTTTKLPTGLKINATTGEVTGVPTKPGTFTTTFKATSVVNAKWIDQISRAYTVAPLPDWAVGTFDGGSEEGVATLTIAATGKISGKWMSAGTNWTLSAASFDAYDSETATYWATVIGKSGKLAFTNDLAISEAGVSSDHFAAWQNKWKIEPQKSEALTLKGQIVTQDVDGGELTLKVGASGTVSVTGRFVTGLDAKGLEIVYTATASSVLVPREAGGWKAIVYLPPKAGKFSGLVTEVAVFGGVQLWENGPYWAECNVGASTPEEFGYYFWWGDTVGYWRQEENWSAVDGSMTGFLFSEDNCPTYGRSNSQLMLAGYIDVTGKLVPAHDAATAHLGTPWRMPTAQEIDDLISNCTVTWMSFRGVYGCQVVGKGKYASRSIFFPAAGHCFDSCLNAAGSYGFYWTSTNGSFYGNEDPGYAWDFCFFSFSHISERYCSSRWDGHPIRPVRGFAK